MATRTDNTFDYLKVDGHRMAVALHGEPGDQLPVVCLHGLASSLGIWEAAFPGWLEDRFRIDLSLPGHYPAAFPNDLRPAEIDDRMFADVLEGALEQLVGSQPVIVIGWSTGGFSAFSLAIRYPQRVAAIASLAGFAGEMLSGLFGWAVWFARASVRRPVFRFSLRRTIRSRKLYRWVNECLSAEPASCKSDEVRAILDTAYEEFRQHNPKSLAHLFAAVPNWDISDKLDQIRVPTLIAGAADDPIIRARYTRRLAESIPGAELKLWENAGHLIFCEWEGLPKYLAAWLQRLPAPEATVEAGPQRADNRTTKRDLARRLHGE